MNVYFACSATKAFPSTLRASDYSSKEEWHNAVANAKERYPVLDLYCGAYWNEVRGVVKDFPEHAFFVLSAGLGIQPMAALQPSYDASFSRRSLNPIPLEWFPYRAVTGVISASNDYATIAKACGITLLSPSGRRWLSLLGGTGFTLAPRLMRHFLSGNDLAADYAGLALPTKQPLPSGRCKCSDDLLQTFYTGQSAQQLRRDVNSSGFQLSVERAYAFIRQQQKIIQK